MYPSSCRIFAMSLLIRDKGMSTRVCLALTALRIRVSMSAIGSVITLSRNRFLVLRSRFWVLVLGAGSMFRWNEEPERRTKNQEPGTQNRRLPAAFRDPGDVAFECELAEAQTAEAELPHVGPRPAAQMATVAQPNLEL